jgi:hypothetical protein
MCHVMKIVLKISNDICFVKFLNFIWNILCSLTKL